MGLDGHNDCQGDLNCSYVLFANLVKMPVNGMNDGMA